MSGNPVIGHITCPHCGNEQATVHRERKAGKKLYYRCYGGPHGDCGTVQIRYQGGQRFIEQNMRPLDTVQQDNEVQAVAIEATETATAEIRKERTEHKKRSGLGAILFGDGSDNDD